MPETQNLGIPQTSFFSSTTPNNGQLYAHHGFDNHTTPAWSKHGTNTSIANSPGVVTNLPYDSVVEDQRRISSVIVKEEYLQGNTSHKTEEIKYVEVPFVEEIVRTVPRKEIIEVEKRVPKIEYQYVDRTVEVPRIEYVDRIVEVPKYEEEIKYVTKHEIVDVPREVIEEVPVIETRVREQIIDVPGQIIEVPKKQVVEKEIILPRYVREEQPVVVAQTLKPQFVPSREVYNVNVNHYEAEIVEVEIPIAKIVDVPMSLAGIVSERHIPVEVSAAQYNSMIKILNPHIASEQLTEAAVLRKEGNGFPELRPEEARMFLPLNSNFDIAGHNQVHRRNGGHRDPHFRSRWHASHALPGPVPLRPMRASPAVNANPPYASNLGINAGIATFPAYESTYVSGAKSSKHSRKSHGKVK